MRTPTGREEEYLRRLVGQIRFVGDGHECYEHAYVLGNRVVYLSQN